MKHSKKYLALGLTLAAAVTLASTTTAHAEPVVSYTPGNGDLGEETLKEYGFIYNNQNNPDATIHYNFGTRTVPEILKEASISDYENGLKNDFGYTDEDLAIARGEGATTPATTPEQPTTQPTEPNQPVTPSKPADETKPSEEVKPSEETKPATEQKDDVKPEAKPTTPSGSDQTSESSASQGVDQTAKPSHPSSKDSKEAVKPAVTQTVPSTDASYSSPTGGQSTGTSSKTDQKQVAQQEDSKAPTLPSKNQDGQTLDKEVQPQSAEAKTATTDSTQGQLPKTGEMSSPLAWLGAFLSLGVLAGVAKKVKR